MAGEEAGEGEEGDGPFGEGGEGGEGPGGGDAAEDGGEPGHGEVDWVDHWDEGSGSGVGKGRKPVLVLGIRLVEFIRDLCKLSREYLKPCGVALWNGS